jgi:hypothetical protein
LQPIEDSQENDMNTRHIAIAAALLATGGTAAAQTATEARCIILSNAFAKQAKDANAQKLAEASLYFYLGRIAGQPTTAQMKAVMDQQAKTITQANAGTLMQDCALPVQSKVALLESLNDQSPPPATPPKT